MIRKAQKPFIFVGGGAVISNASEELRVFAHKIQAPVADSLMGKAHLTVPMNCIQVWLVCTELRLPTTALQRQTC